MGIWCDLRLEVCYNTGMSVASPSGLFINCGVFVDYVLTGLVEFILWVWGAG